MTGSEWRKFLYDNMVYDAYQYISNARKAIGIALFCKDLILALISKMENGNAEWQDSLFAQLFRQEGEIKSVAVKASSLPKYNFEVCGVETTVPFLLDKLTKDFFQYARNSFDCMSQAVNVSCLASHAEKTERVDFGYMRKVFQRQTKAQMFPTISSWYAQIAESSEFSYIDAFNNRTKHICDVYLKLSMSLLGSENESTINSFFKNGVQHQQQSVPEHLTAIYDFVSNSYSELLSRLNAEIPQKQLVGTRYHKLRVYQQKMDSNDDSSFAMVYIDANTEIENMPDEIEVLLAAENEGEIFAKNCPVKNIYIKNPQAESNYDYLGQYISDDSFGDDILLKYRKYKKQPHLEGSLPLACQAMLDPESKGTFYHANPFMDIISVSDDKEFQQRAQLPF